MTDLRARVSATEKRVAAVEESVAWIKRGSIVKVRGSLTLEALWQAEVESETGGGFKALKRLAGQHLSQEVATFFGYKWPELLTADERAQLSFGTPDYYKYDIVNDFCGLVRKPGLVVNVYKQNSQGQEVDEGSHREPGSFKLQLDFGSRMLLLKDTLCDGLTALLRERSGEDVWDNQTAAEYLGITTVPRPQPGRAGEAAAPEPGQQPAQPATRPGAGAPRQAADGEEEDAGMDGDGDAEGAGGPELGDVFAAPAAPPATGTRGALDGTWLQVTIPPVKTQRRHHGRPERSRSDRAPAGGRVDRAPAGSGSALPPAGAVAKAFRASPPTKDKGGKSSGPKGHGKGDKGPKGHGKGGKGAKDKGKGKGKGKGKDRAPSRPPARRR